MITPWWNFWGKNGIVTGEHPTVSNTRNKKQRSRSRKTVTRLRDLLLCRYTRWLCCVRYAVGVSFVKYSNTFVK